MLRTVEMGEGGVDVEVRVTASPPSLTSASSLWSGERADRGDSSEANNRRIIMTGFARKYPISQSYSFSPSTSMEILMKISGTGYSQRMAAEALNCVILFLSMLYESCIKRGMPMTAREYSHQYVIPSWRWVGNTASSETGRSYAEMSA